MAEEATIGGLIERVRAEGQLTRNSGTNSIKSVNVTLKSYQPLFESMRQSLSLHTIELFSIRSILQEANAMTVEQMEDMKRQQELAVQPKPQPTDDSSDPASVGNNQENNETAVNLGIFGTALAASLGATAGLLAGQLKAVQGFASMFSPKSLKDSIKGMRLAIAMNIELLKTSFIEKIASVKTSVLNGLERVKSFLRISPDGALGKALAAFKSFFAPITSLFNTAASTLSSIVAPAGKTGLGIINKTLTLISGYFKSLGSLVGTVASTVGKIFAPIAVVITLFDTVKGAIDGYAEGGILGGLEGAINGFFTSLVTKPLDLVKDAVAWVLGKFGFDESSEAIKSFSFTELFKKATGAIFDFIDGAIGWVSTKWTEAKTAVTKGITDAFAVVTDLFTFGEEDKTAMGIMGKLTDIVFAPVNMAINFVRGMFGFNEEEAETFKLQDFMAEKFTQVANFFGTIPDKVMYSAKEMFINVKAKLEKGFIMFGEWFASIPDRIKVAALETIRSVPGGGLLVSQGDVNEARATLNNRSGDVANRLQAVEDRRLAQLAELERTAPSNNVVAPTTINNGGNTTNTTTNIYSNTSSLPSTDPALD